MKKRYLKAWVQDMLIISMLSKIGIACIVIEQMFNSKLTMAVALYVVISLGVEAYVFSKYDLRPSMLFEGRSKC